MHIDVCESMRLFGDVGHVEAHTCGVERAGKCYKLVMTAHRMGTVRFVIGEGTAGGDGVLWNNREKTNKHAQALFRAKTIRRAQPRINPG